MSTDPRRLASHGVGSVNPEVVPMQVVLIMFRTGGEHRSFSVSRSTTTIGRREDCDLRIPVGDVSRKHCRLLLAADSVRIQDLGSSNGTFVNGQRISDAFLNPGDAVSVGPVHFVVQIDGVPDEDQVVAPTDAAPAATDDAGVVEDAGLLEEVPDPAGAALADDLVIDPHPVPASAEGMTIDEVPAAQDAAFDLTTEADPDPVTTDDLTAEATPAGEVGEWDFLAGEAPAHSSHADLHVDLDAAHGSNPHA